MLPAVLLVALVVLLCVLVGLLVAGTVAITSEDAEAVVDDLARLIAGRKSRS